MKILKYLMYFLIFALIAICLFYFWASSPIHSQEDYAKLAVNNDITAIDNDSTISIITYNIGYLSGMTNNRAVKSDQSLYDANLKKVLEEFEKVDADIIAFQEIDYNSARSYDVHQQNDIAALGYPHSAQAVNWDEHYLPFPYGPPSMHYGRMYSGQSILSKYPLEDHQRIVLQRVKDSPFWRDAFYLDRILQIVKTNIQGQDIIVMNVHLEAFDEPTRRSQMETVIQLLEKYKDQYPTILLGDFNSPVKNKDACIYRLLNMPELGTAALTTDQIANGGYANTFESANPFKRIDYIFYTKEHFDYVGGRVLSEFGEASDHLPVLMECRLK